MVLGNNIILKVRLEDLCPPEMSELLGHVNTLLDINHKRTTAYHPACNGKIERIWRTAKTMLAHFCCPETQRDWCTYVPFIRYVMNQSWHASINTSPAYLFFGRTISTPLKLLLPKPPRESNRGMTMLNKWSQKFNRCGNRLGFR